MRRLLVLIVLLLPAAVPAGAMPLMRFVPPSAVQPAHGCHQSWRSSERGWHRHGPTCDTREGEADRSRRGSKARKSAA